MGGINYLFPPDQIEDLPTWRFVFHFIAPDPYDPQNLVVAISQLKKAEWKIIEFPLPLDNLQFDPKNHCIDISVEVVESERQKDNSLADYESDVWKIFGNMASCGFEEIYYEAIDWQE